MQDERRREAVRLCSKLGKREQRKCCVECVDLGCEQVVANIGEDLTADQFEASVRVDRVLLRARQRTERRIAAAEIRAVQLRQVIDVRARIGERVGLGQPPLEMDDPSDRRQPLRCVDDLPALAIAEARSSTSRFSVGSRSLP